MYIKLRVFVNAKRELLTQISKDHFEAVVREKAERNMANRRVIELIARHYKIPAGKVRIATGHHSPSKILAIDE